MQVWPGNRYPLGATYDGQGTNFAIFSEVAERVELCLFDDDGVEDAHRARSRSTRFVWHAYLPGRRARAALRLPGARPVRPRPRPAVQPATSCCSTRTPRRSTATIDWDPARLRLRLRRPRAMSQRRRLGAVHAEGGRGQPVLRLGRRPRAAHAVPRHVIYEAHVQGPDRCATRTMPEELRGTYAGLAPPGDHRAPDAASASPRSS